MSEQDKELEAEAAGPESKGSARKWIIIGLVVLVLGGGGYAARDFLLAERFPGRNDLQTGETGQKTTETNDGKLGTIYEIEPFIVNLFDREGKRYLKTTIGLEVENDDIKEELTRRTPQLRDAVLLLLTSKSFEDIAQPQGKLRLKNELISRINQILPTASIRALYFTEFVVQ
jgi:flagellar FliL protein